MITPFPLYYYVIEMETPLSAQTPLALRQRFQLSILQVFYFRDYKKRLTPEQLKGYLVLMKMTPGRTVAAREHIEKNGLRIDKGRFGIVLATRSEQDAKQQGTVLVKFHRSGVLSVNPDQLLLP